MASKLEHALAWASRGFRIFPLVANGKEPAISGFTEHATTDPAMLSTWWTDPVTGVQRDYNIGVLTSDMVVADVDVKRGKPGLETYRNLGGHFQTLTVGTTTGGYHCYFSGPDSSLAPIGPGLDIRSHNGYVVAPGSSIGGQEYKLLVDAPIADVPDTIKSRLRPPGERDLSRHDGNVEIDAPNAIKLAAAWLAQGAEPAVEGHGGDNVTYKTACRLVRDYALSEETAFYLMAEYWNERCFPPWDPDELWGKVDNAYTYSTGDLGTAKPEHTFGAVTLPDASILTPIAQDTGFGNALDLADVPPRPWIMHRMLMRRAVTMVPGVGSAGKSTFVLAVAAHLALGLDFGPFKCVVASCSVIYNAEDDMDEQTRRLYAVCQEYKLNYEMVRDRIMLITGDENPLLLAQNAGRSAVQVRPHVEALISKCSAEYVGMLALDPMAEMHMCDEADNGQMRFVMSTIRQIAREANISVLVPHHMSKSPGGQVSRAGSADSARGASAIVNSARIAMTLFAPTDEDIQRYGIPDEDRFKYVRLDDAKTNMTLSSEQSVWFKKVGSRLYNGDDVGVLMLHDMAANETSMRRSLALALRDKLHSVNRSNMSIKAAAETVRQVDPIYERMTDTQLRNKIERLLSQGYTLDEKTIMCERTPGDHGKDTVVVKLC